MEFYYLFNKLLSSEFKGFDSKKLEREEIETLYNQEKWKLVMERLVQINMRQKHNNLITARAYKLSKKIKEQIGVEVFPVIERQYLGAIHNDEGYWTWKMYTENLFPVGSNESTKDLLLKCVKLETLDEDDRFYNNSIELIGNKIK